MNQPHDNFGDLRRLLSWKRHEQPPPGYFNDFSARIILRLEVANQLEPGSAWTRWLRNFDAKPILVCAYGLAVGGTLFFGFSFFGMGEANPTNLSGPSGLWFTGGQGWSVQIKNDLSPLKSFDANPAAASITPAVAR